MSISRIFSRGAHWIYLGIFFGEVHVGPAALSNRLSDFHHEPGSMYVGQCFALDGAVHKWWADG
jgi:hypothetical protein